LQNSADLPKAVVKLEPPWIRVLTEDSVTLKCEGTHNPGNYSTQWLHNGRSIRSQIGPNYTFKATVNDSGEYQCRLEQTILSDPVQLEVIADWLILQVPYAAVFEGEPLVMRCRGWYDKVVYKLHYYHDGQAVRYFHSSTNYTVLQARASDSGHYQCSGTMRIPVESAPMFSSKVAVTVQGRRGDHWEILGLESEGCALQPVV
ncbi:Fc receptor-like B, partial [Lemmus lemmus]